MRLLQVSVFLISVMQTAQGKFAVGGPNPITYRFESVMPVSCWPRTKARRQILIPFNTALTLVVHPSFYRVSDASGAVVAQNASKKISLTVASGQQVVPMTFTVSGVGQ